MWIQAKISTFYCPLTIEKGLVFLLFNSRNADSFYFDVSLFYI